MQPPPAGHIMYYIALVLPPGLNEKVLSHKQYMLEHFRCRVGLKSPAHLTLVPPFWMHPQKEAALVRDLDAFSGTQAPFTLATKGFSAFRPRTIFIDPLPSTRLAELKKASDAWFGPKPDYGLKIDNRPFHPHITIATRDLFKKDFAEAWAYFEHRPFEAEWTVDGLSLLRHNGRAWDVIHTAAFVERG